MPRTPPAARQLVTEVLAYDDSTEAEYTGEPDGFGVTREVTFHDAEWLKDILDVLDDDRIASITGRKHIVVTLVGDSRADFPEPFGIATVAEVLYSEAEEDPQSAEDEPDGQGEDDQDGGEDEAEAEQAQDGSQ